MSDLRTTPPAPSGAQPRRTAKLWAGLALALIAVLVGVLLAFDRSTARPVAPAADGPSRPVMAQPSGESASAPAAAPAARSCPMQLDQVYGYDAQAQIGAAGAPSPATVIGWRVALRPVQRLADGTTIASGRLSQLSSPTLPPRIAQARPDELEFQVALGSDCSQQSYAWRRDSADVVARYVQARLADFDFSLPARHGEVVEGSAVDEAGRYRFAEIGSSGSNGTVVHRRKLGWPDAAAVAGPVAVEGSGLAVHLAPNGFVERADMEVRLRQLSSIAGERTLQVTAQLRRLDGWTDAPPPTVKQNEDGWLWGNLLTVASARNRAQLDADKILAALPWERLAAELAGLDDAADRAMAAAARIAAWLAARPGAVAELRAWLRATAGRYDQGDVLARIALQALGRCGVPAARAALVELAGDAALGSAERLHALMQLGGEGSLGRDDLARLRTLSAQRPEDPTGVAVAAAALAMTGLAARHPDQDPAAAREALELLGNALRTEKDEAWLKAAVSGAGAAGQSELADELWDLTDHPSADVRARVAGSLGDISGALAGAALTAWLDKEVSPKVLVRLLQAAQMSAVSADLAAWAVERLATEGNPTVARELVAIVGGTIAGGAHNAPAAGAANSQARKALLERFGAELAHGTNPDLLVQIGAYLPAEELPVGP